MGTHMGVYFTKRNRCKPLVDIFVSCSYNDPSFSTNRKKINNKVTREINTQKTESVGGGTVLEL